TPVEDAATESRAEGAALVGKAAHVAVARAVRGHDAHGIGNVVVGKRVLPADAHGAAEHVTLDRRIRGIVGTGDIVAEFRRVVGIQQAVVQAHEVSGHAGKERTAHAVYGSVRAHHDAAGDAGGVSSLAGRHLGNHEIV